MFYQNEASMFLEGDLKKFKCASVGGPHDGAIDQLLRHVMIGGRRTPDPASYAMLAPTKGASAARGPQVSDRSRDLAAPTNQLYE